MRKNKKQDEGGFITPDGRFWPCGSGEHGFTAADLINRNNADELIGTVVIWPNGLWDLEGAIATTADQRETLGLMKRYPNTTPFRGLRKAAYDILKPKTSL